jgi:hypothetical protein
MAGNAPVARLVIGVEIDEKQNEDKLNKKKRHARPVPEEFPEFAKSHRRIEYHKNAADKILFLFYSIIINHAFWRMGRTADMNSVARPL